MSSPMEADTWDVEPDLGKIEQQWASLVALTEDAELFGLRADAVSGWGVGEQVGHVALVCAGIAGQIEALLAKPETGVGETYKDFAEAMLASGTIPRGAGKAPDAVAVQGEPDAAKIRSELHAARARWAGLGERADEMAASRATYPHFALGALTPANWARFVAVHTAHHLKIVKDILDATTGADLPE